MISNDTPEPQSRVSTLELVLLCAIVFLSPLIAGKLAPIPAFSMQALTLIAALAWVIRSSKAGRIVLPGGWLLGLLVAFWVFLKISAWHSASLYLTIRELLNFASYLLVFLMIIGLRERRSVYAVLASLGISAFVVGVLGVKEYMLSGGGGWRVFSTFFNPDFLAGFAVMILPVALGWYLSRTSSAVSVVAGLVVLFMVGTILTTGSRFGALAAVIGVFVFLVLAAASGSLREARIPKILLILIPLIAVQIFLSRPLTARVASTKAEAHSGGFRLYTWKGTARMAAANPIHGTGLGTFAIAYPRYALVGYTKLTHNTYLQLAAEAGVPCAAALVLLLASSTLPPMVLVLKRHIKPDPELSQDPTALLWMPEIGLILSGLIGGAVASIARNAVDSDWYVTAIGISFWAILGAVVALSGSGTTSLHLSRRVAIFAGMALVLSMVGISTMLSGELMAALGETAGPRNPESASRFYGLGVKLDPLNAEYHRRLAKSYLLLEYLVPEGGGSVDDAAIEISKAVALEPGNARNYYQLGRVEEFYPNHAGAISAYQEALRLSPGAPEVMLVLARAHESAGDHAQAMGVYEQMAQVENSPYEQVKAVPEYVTPEYAFAHFALGMEAERAGDKAGAIREFRSALDRADRYLESAKSWRQILEANGRRDSNMEKDVALVKLESQRELKTLLGGRD